MFDTTTTLGTSTVLDYLGVEEDSIATMATTVSTSLTTSHPVNNYHYYYHCADSYVNSLSDTELARLTNLIEEKETNEKQLVITKQS